jgi:hypothetical protein
MNQLREIKQENEKANRQLTDVVAQSDLVGLAGVTNSLVLVSGVATCVRNR